MTGADKAAILLLYLGNEVTAKVFEHMDDDEIKKISKSMAKLGHVTRTTIMEVVESFSAITNPESGIFSQGDEFVRKILEKALGPVKAEMLMEELAASSYGDLVDILSNMDSKSIANFLSQEHPQTIAVILAKLKSKQTSEIISLLPHELQAEVVLRIADVEQVSPEILQEIDEVMKKELKSMGGTQRYKVGGIEKVVDMFNHFDRSKEKQILDKLDVLSPPLSEIIRKHLFTFDDVFQLDDRSIQSIMREVSNDTLTLAMKTSTDDVKDKIFRNISSRAAEMIKEDLEVMGPVRLSDVEKAQGEIIKIVRKMEEEGKVVLAGRGGDDVLV
ncbi:flagellar motor switch protein FliG [Pelotalea chapellei]|uniref:Flagellar motor switch protein FliG n=1 Tax=Pelotalea chapellei TaxID=44671 RepID=A0ABS5U8E9_9BACT|nr:flagellar motor switch protein FliG [Pelotalea chapellei]MBT1071951.1 flagellar motor switch protein FliG [Pelotalea chapellei]